MLEDESAAASRVDAHQGLFEVNARRSLIMKTLVTRRHFVRTQLAAALAAAAFPSIIPAAALGKNGRPSPSNRITVGCIGVGPQGRNGLGGFLHQSDAQVVALCDLAQRNLDAAMTQVQEAYSGNPCARHGDFHELLARKDIDAVLVATPDHWHVPVAVAAARAQKDIYLEKPMGLSLAEDQLLRDAVRKHKAVFQFGTQQRSSAEFRRACEIVRNGRIGKLKQINVWCSASRPGGSTLPVVAPKDLNYDTWLGPAQYAPYTDGKCFDNDPAGSWKTWWHRSDYALGFIAGWGIHPLDIAYWGHPSMMSGTIELSGKGIFPTEGACNCAIAWDLDFTFADGVRMQYKGAPNGYDKIEELNDLRPWHERYGKVVDHGTAFEGTDGWVMVHRGGLHTFPEQLAELRLDAKDQRLTQSSNHVRNFLDSIKSRNKTICPIEEAVQTDTLCHISDIAARLERKLHWNPAKGKFIGDDEANRKLALRPVRDGWRWA